MSHLAPHPWDGVGPVLPPGGNYPIADLHEIVVEVRELIAEASELERDADRAQRAADEAYDGAADARKEAREVIEARIRDVDGDLADRLLKEIDGPEPAWRKGPKPTLERKPEPMGLVAG